MNIVPENAKRANYSLIQSFAYISRSSWNDKQDKLKYRILPGSLCVNIWLKTPSKRLQRQHAHFSQSSEHTHTHTHTHTVTHLHTHTYTQWMTCTNAKHTHTHTLSHILINTPTLTLAGMFIQGGGDMCWSKKTFDNEHFRESSILQCTYRFLQCS